MKFISYFAAICIVICCFDVKKVAGDDVGMIKDGYKKDCKVENKTAQFNCSKGFKLYYGDKITQKNINTLIIRLHPFAKVKKLNASTLLIIFNPPDEKKKISYYLPEFLKFNKEKRKESWAVSPRGDSVVLPNDGATLIYNYPIEFSCGISGEEIVFLNDQKNEIYRGNVRGKKSVIIYLKDIGIKENIDYEWFIDGPKSKKKSSNTFRLLPPKLSERIISDIRLIDNEKISEHSKKIKKSSYFQLISDAYPKDYDLYWLSYQIISDLDENLLDSNNQNLLQELKMNYIMHTATEMGML